MLSPVVVQESSPLPDRYVVRQVDSDVLMIDLETGWTWKRVATRTGKAPRWRQVPKFKSAKEALAWLGENPIGDEVLATDDVRWAVEVLFGLEVQARAEQPTTIRRWVTSPTVSVMGGTEDQQALVKAAAAEINKALKPATRLSLKLIEPNDDRAAIRVYFMPFAKFPEFCRANNLVFSATDFACFYTTWDRSFRITGARVLIAPDRSFGDILQHLVLEELTQTLGPMNDSAFKRDSIFFSGRSSGAKLSDDDKRLLQILYSKLKAGDNKAKAGAIITRSLRKSAGSKP